MPANPFHLPPPHETLAARAAASAATAVARRADASKRVWEKAPLTSTLTETRRAIRDLAPDADPGALRRARAARGVVATATAALARSARPRDAESTAAFIAKKRELLLLQLSIDAKREEIAALEQRAAAEEAAVSAEEAELDAAAARFDAFLKANDAEVRGVRVYACRSRS